jgi:hypothetical protein
VPVFEAAEVFEESYDRRYHCAPPPRRVVSSSEGDALNNSLRPNSEIENVYCSCGPDYNEKLKNARINFPMHVLPSAGM